MNGPEAYDAADRAVGATPLDMTNVAANPAHAIETGLILLRALVLAVQANTAATVNARATAALDQFGDWTAVLGTGGEES